MKITVKQITNENFEDFYTLFEKSISTQFPEYSKATTNWIVKNQRGHNKERTREELNNGSAYACGTFLDNKLIGFAYGFMPWGGISHIYWLAVDPDYHRKGAGSLLLKEWEKVVKEKGGHAIHLESSEWNLEFYKKMGYEIIGHDHKGYFGAEDYYLKKLIQEPQEENFLK
jgi:ribosomal protein S18 acetylase RimI-like enzyme